MHAFPGAIIVPFAEVAPRRGPSWKLMGQGVPLAAGTIQVQDRIDHFTHVSGTGPSSRLGGRKLAFLQNPSTGPFIGLALFHPAPHAFAHSLLLLHERDELPLLS